MPIEIHKCTAREARNYLDSLSPFHLDQDVIISIRFQDKPEYRIKDDELCDLCDLVEEKSKEEPKEELKSIAKARELFEYYYHVFLERSLKENQILMSHEWNKMQAINLTKEYFKGIDELGNSPWDLRE